MCQCAVLKYIFRFFQSNVKSLDLTLETVNFADEVPRPVLREGFL